MSTTLGSSSSMTQLAKSPSTHGLKTSGSTSHLRFTGALQPTQPHRVGRPPVLYNKGGCDFRVVVRSSFGPQPISGKHLTTQGVTVFPEGARFSTDKYRSPGPRYDPVSSMGKQVSSVKASCGKTKFGTSSRDGALKLYAIYTTAPR